MSKLDISDSSKISLPVRNLFALLAATAFGIFAYTEITGRLNSLENSRTIMEADLITKSDQKIVDQEQYLLLEMLSTSQEETDAEMHNMRNNTVELNRAMKDIEEMKKVIELLKDKVRANGSG